MGLNVRFYGAPVLLIVCGLAVPRPAAAEPAVGPTIPIGLDAYRDWDRWPYQRIGARGYMRSTYDRDGGNLTADASGFLYQEADDFNVTLDLVGPGVLYFVRTNHWHGSPWHYEVDGVDHIVQETTTATPNERVPNSTFIPEELFPNPLTWTWSITKGADLMWVPIPFEESLRLAYSRTFYGTGYYIFHRYAEGAPLSQPIKSWDGTTPPDEDVLDLIRRSGTDIAPTDIPTERGSVQVGDGQPVQLLRLEGEPRMIRALKLTLPREQALKLGDARLRITWDDREHASVDAPLDLFFGAGIFYNRDGREYLVKGFPMNVRYTDDTVELACYYPMPFFRSATVELLDAKLDEPGEIAFEIRHEPYTDSPNHVGYFHATHQDHPEPEPGEDLVLLDTREIEGGGDWSGSFVGTSFIFSHDGVLTTLEGDPRFFFDDSQTPEYGTGTEEWGGGGDYWGGENMTLPFAGHPAGARPGQAKDEHDAVQSAYRFLLADLFPFGKNAVIRLEHGGENLSTEHYTTVTYWYGLPAASVVKTDELNVGDPADEAEHDYKSPDASEPEEITSRYEWGVDTIHFSAEQHPLRDPANYAEWEFEAEVDRTYYIWLRGRALENNNKTDSVWLQFNDQIKTRRPGPQYAPFGFGNWLDTSPELNYRWSSGLPQNEPLTVRFDKPGRQRLRLQPRHPGHVIDQIWLSTSQTALPGSAARPPRQEATDEIVLDASDAELAGALELIDDENAAGGKALLIQSGSIEVYPAHTEVGRHTTGASEFTLQIRPDNFGVFLRRTLDYRFPNQRANIYIADASTPGAESQWEQAGVWYTAGSNTWYHSWPRGELAPPDPTVKSSNRRFRDDEFLIPHRLTDGRSAIRVRVEFTPVERPLLPGQPIPDLAWSEIRYHAYCWIMPEFQP